MYASINKRGDFVKSIKYLVCALLLLLCLCFLACGDGTGGDEPPTEEKITDAYVDILKIGKADCIVINTGSKIVMIDTGEAENLPKIHQYMERNGYEKFPSILP